jgi:hypothetical protein
MSLDFARGADLFMASEQELAAALGISIADLRELRTNPKRANPAIEERLGRVLVERGKAMVRVGELLLE